MAQLLETGIELAMTTIRPLPNPDRGPRTDVFLGAEIKTVRLTLNAGERVAPHQHLEREVVLYLLQGRTTVQLGEKNLNSRTEISHGSAAIRISHLLQILPVKYLLFWSHK
jgi:quercetin dioxygenase-like cupin family protein